MSTPTPESAQPTSSATSDSPVSVPVPEQALPTAQTPIATDAPTSKPEPARPGPQALRLRYRVSLEDCRETVVELENRLDLRITADPDGLARLADQVKLLISTMAVEPLLTELNGWIRLRFEANKPKVLGPAHDDLPDGFPLGGSTRVD